MSLFRAGLRFGVSRFARSLLPSLRFRCLDTVTSLAAADPQLHRHIPFLRTGFACLCVLLVLGGCGRGNPLGRKPVLGTVTLDGRPLAAGNISFVSQGETSEVQSGGPISNGSYSLSVASGLPVGKYLVRIFASPPEAGDEATQPFQAKRNAIFVDPIPPEYNVASQQYIEVTEKGPNEFHFAIESKKQ